MISVASLQTYIFTYEIKKYVHQPKVTIAMSNSKLTDLHVDGESSNDRPPIDKAWEPRDSLVTQKICLCILTKQGNGKFKTAL